MTLIKECCVSYNNVHNLFLWYSHFYFLIEHAELNNITSQNLKSEGKILISSCKYAERQSVKTNYYITLFYLINPATNLCTGCIFKSWENIDTIMEAYGKKHEFTTIKKWLMRHEDGSIKHCSFGCEFGDNYQLRK